MFQFDLPSAFLKKRAEKFDSVLLNWHYTELLVKILCIFWFIVSFYIMYASTYGWIKVNISDLCTETAATAHHEAINNY